MTHQNDQAILTAFQKTGLGFVLLRSVQKRSLHLSDLLSPTKPYSHSQSNDWAGYDRWWRSYEKKQTLLFLPHVVLVQLISRAHGLTAFPPGIGPSADLLEQKEHGGCFCARPWVLLLSPQALNAFEPFAGVEDIEFGPRISNWEVLYIQDTNQTEADQNQV